MNTDVRVPEWEGSPIEVWRQLWQIPRLQVFQRVSSTNDSVRLAGRNGAPAGTTAIADYQSGGRGRLGRAWEAPAGAALLLSVLLRPAPGGRSDAAGTLPLRVGLGLAAAIRFLTGEAPTLKWPNDVLLGGGKLAGILCEAAADSVVVGIGVNVRQVDADFPPELTGQATSLRLVTGESCSRADLAGAILQQLQPLFTAPHRPLEPAELERYAALDALACHDLTIDDHPVGVGAGISPLGALLVDHPGGQQTFYAGTVRSTP